MVRAPRKQPSYEPTVAVWVMLGRRTGALVGVSLLVLLSSVTVAVPSGIGQEGNEGCLCHAQEPSTKVLLSGLPDRYESNTTYSLMLTVDSPVPVDEDHHQGGFRLLVSNGTLEGNSTELQALDGGWTNTEASSYQRVWNITWRSPVDNTSRTDFVVHGNAVNGNNAPTEDGWSTFEVVVPGAGYVGEVTPDEGIDGLSSTDRIVLAVGLLMLVGLLWAVARP